MIDQNAESITEQIIWRWKRRALRAEQHLRRLGIEKTPLAYSDDEYLTIVLEHVDGRVATVDEIKAAKARIEAEKLEFAQKHSLPKGD